MTASAGKAREMGVAWSIVRDAGRTQVCNIILSVNKKPSLLLNYKDDARSS